MCARQQRGVEQGNQQPGYARRLTLGEPQARQIRSRPQRETAGVRMTAMMTADVDDVDRAEGAMRGV